MVHSTFAKQDDVVRPKGRGVFCDADLGGNIGSEGFVTSQSFSVENGRFGEMLVVRGAWTEDIGGLMRRRGIREIEVNYAKGFQGKDVSFLAGLADLLDVLLLMHRTIEDVSAVNDLHALRILELNTYCKTAIDFTGMPRLEECVLEWRAKAKSLFQCRSLRKLFINRYSSHTVDEFTQLPALRQLSLASPATDDLRGIAGCVGLETLGLYNARKLTTLDGVEETRLTRLEVNESKRVGSIAAVERIGTLIAIQLNECGQIESLQSLAGNPDLEEVLFYGSTHILDGDLSILTRLPRLTKISFQNRRHYSTTREVLQAWITARGR